MEPHEIQTRARQFLELSLEHFDTRNLSDTTETSETTENSEDSESSENSEGSESTESSEDTENAEISRPMLEHVLQANLVPGEWGQVIRLFERINILPQLADSPRDWGRFPELPQDTEG